MFWQSEEGYYQRDAMYSIRMIYLYFFLIRQYQYLDDLTTISTCINLRRAIPSRSVKTCKLKQRLVKTPPLLLPKYPCPFTALYFVLRNHPISGSYLLELVTLKKEVDMAFNFEDKQKDAINLLKKVAEEMGTEDMNQAGRVFRAVLQAIRDRLPVNDAVHFAAQLPIIWKGIYYDQYDPAKVPVKIRDRQEWINFIRSKNAYAANNDFLQDSDIIEAFQAVFKALHHCVSTGELQKVKDAMHQDIQELLEV